MGVDTFLHNTFVYSYYTLDKTIRHVTDKILFIKLSSRTLVVTYLLTMAYLLATLNSICSDTFDIIVSIILIFSD